MTESAADIRVVLVEDDARLAQLTARYFAVHGVTVVCCDDGPAGVAEVIQRPPDVVLLDVMLPRLDGVAVCRRIRERSDVPIVMLTARREEADRVIGLEAGADDYVLKPFSSRELLARVRAQARRRRGLLAVGPLVRVGALAIDPSAQRATLDGRALPLTTTEFALLNALASRAGRVLSREQLIQAVRGSADEMFDRAIDVHVSRLRHKLGDDPRHPRWLVTVRGAGYLFAPGETG